jgi:hypothetical protein
MTVVDTFRCLVSPIVILMNDDRDHRRHGRPIQLKESDRLIREWLTASGAGTLKALNLKDF